MDGQAIFFLTSAVLGGLALFIFGIQTMTEGLRRAAGSRLRTLLTAATSHRLTGISLGTLFGLLIHSSGASVMLVGFVNAGLMTLTQSIPVLLGANIGTTLSMQAISFRLGDFAFFIITIGFLLRMAGPSATFRHSGSALLGFGLLFLGMTIMSDAIRPHRADLAPWLTHFSSATWSGLLLGVLLAAAFTAVVQSSGATIGICFALIEVGVFTQLEQTMPIILGAHIGTCITALLGSLGANIQARRTAFAHLGFNLFNVALTLVAHRLFLWLIPLTSADLLRQTANLHTAVMLVAALLILPVTPGFAALLQKLIRSRKTEPTPSFLDPGLLEYPEKALQACILELQRVARLCSRSLLISAETVLFSQSRHELREIKLNEQAVNAVKLSMKEYLTQLTERYLSKRQAVLIQHIDRCMIDLERIGDHIDAIGQLSLRRRKNPDALVDAESLTLLFDLYARALKIFRAVIASLTPEDKDVQAKAERILRLRDDYILMSMNTKAAFTDKVSQRLITPIAGFYFSEYIAALDRIVKHSKSIALAERQPQFWIKRKKLDRTARKAPAIERPQLVDPQDYLDRLQTEDYL
jgi:phosphate:Na+ symporter